MNVECPHCRGQNPPQANYCATCGRSVQHTTFRTPPRITGGRGAILLALVLLVAFLAVKAPRIQGIRSMFRSSTTLVRHDFDLPSNKADAFFELLAPSDIKVVVGQRSGGVFINGTPRETDVLKRFAELLTRLEGCCADSIDQAMDQLRSGWTVTETYQLPESHARVLIDILAVRDVPVLVSGGGTSIRVTATAADQQTIDQLVDILHGQR